MTAGTQNELPKDLSLHFKKLIQPVVIDDASCECAQTIRRCFLKIKICTFSVLLQIQKKKGLESETFSIAFSWQKR